MMGTPEKHQTEDLISEKGMGVRHVDETWIEVVNLKLRATRFRRSQ
jgi:hypothetical protein